MAPYALLRASRPRSRVGTVAALLTGLLLAALSATPVGATNFAVTVTTTADSENVSCYDALIPPCSLRDAIRFANSFSPPSMTTITLPAGAYTLSIPGTGEDQAGTGDLDLNKQIVIVGAGAASTIVQASPNGNNRIDRVFDVGGSGLFPGANATINGVTIRYGGGGVTTGGGIQVSGSGSTLTLNGCVVTDNAATAAGGGIYVGTGASVTLNQTVVQDNIVQAGTSIDAFGGGIDIVGGTATITDSTIIANQAIGGNAGAPGSGLNGGAALGGGIADHTPATVTLTRSTVVNNVVQGGSATAGSGTEAIGGPAFGGGINGGGTWTIANTTVVGNRAVGGPGAAGKDGAAANGEGGGVWITEKTHLVNDTIVSNVAMGGAANGAPIDGYAAGGGMFGIATIANATPVLTNTLIAGNTVVSTSSAIGPDLGMKIGGGGRNLIGIGDGGSGYNATDLVGTASMPLNPKVGALANNHGPTQTLALLPGSPAINAGDPIACTNAPVSGKDQRGILRRGDQCSIGAFEGAPVIPNASPPSRGPSGGGGPGPIPAVPRSQAGTGGGTPDPLPQFRP